MFFCARVNRDYKSRGSRILEEKTEKEKILKMIRAVAWMSLLLFFLLMLPILYLSFVNRASGDDYGYGTLTRAAWMGSHSLMPVIRAAWQTVRDYYGAWQGTWFSIFVFSLQPEVFHDGAYVIVAFMMLFLWIGSTFYLFNQILCRHMKFPKWCYLLVTVCFLLISIEFVPSPKSSIFWFNGCAHYMLPFTMCQMAAAWLLKYGETYRKRYLFGSIVFMALLGGSNYQAALLALITACYVGISVYFLKKEKKILFLAVPVLIEAAGLIISMKAPGNKVRAGVDFGFSAVDGIRTIGCSFLYGIKDIGTYLYERPLIFAGLLFLFLVFLTVFCAFEEVYCFRHPVWLSAMLFCLYSAMQAPAIYAGVSVSRGVLNTNFQVFLFTAAGILLILAQKAVRKIKEMWKEEANRKVFRRITVPGIIICLFLLILCRSSVKISTSWVSLLYITSGEAADYREQMTLQTRLMEDENTADVIVPFINDVQGPLMHMPVTSDETKWTNTVTAQFYGKNSVTAIERPLWMELYGEAYGEGPNE